MNKQKYLLLGKLDEIMAKLQQLQKNNKSNSPDDDNILSPDFKIEGDMVWVNVSDLCKMFGVPDNFFLSDNLLDAMNNWAEKINVFPIREFETK